MAAMLLHKSCMHYSSPKKEKGVEMSKNLEGQRRGCRTGTREKDGAVGGPIKSKGSKVGFGLGSNETQKSTGVLAGATSLQPSIKLWMLVPFFDDWKS